jgi:hemerythrin-like metal-binding protein
MALMEWNPSLSVSVDEMDQEHQKLIQLVNDLYEAMKAGIEKKEMDQVFDTLTTYTQNHFSSEETFLQSIGYPDLDVHKIEHQKLISSVEDFKDQYDAGQAMVSMKLIGFLRDWVHNHIQQTDMKYSDYTNQPV